MSNKNNSWKIELSKKLPWAITFLIASFFFFKFEIELPGWICLIIAIVSLFLVIKFEHYERIINRQEKQIKQCNKQAIQSQKDTMQTLTDANMAISSQIGNNSYQKNKDQTDII